MNRHYFGTDGVRGRWGGPVINEGFARRLGTAAGRWALRREGGEAAGREVLIGRDTRASGPALVAAIAAGLAEAGLRPTDLGVVPTPAVSRAVRQRRAALGVVVTASHNPSSDNGIKFFGPAGTKLSDEEEFDIEQLLARGKSEAAAAGPVAVPGAADDYVAVASGLLPPGSLSGWRIVLDTANGAACATSPAALRRLGAEVIGIGDVPDGLNINAGVGSEHPAPLCQAVLEHGARLGIAHDGDGDRCILCDEKGEILDGDEILTVLAVDALRRGALAARTLVVTVQSNLGVDAAVQAAGGRVCRTPVGDRYVGERLRAEGAQLGGESSGHIICAEVSPTGDGLVAAIKVIGVMVSTGRPLSELRGVLQKFPQRSVALTVVEKKPLESLLALQDAMAAVETGLGPEGRVLVRYSGTEPKIRLLVEGRCEGQVREGLDRLVKAVREDLTVTHPAP